jgi:hypothetical protein
MKLIMEVKYLGTDTELKWQEIKRYACTVLVTCSKLKNQVDGVVVTFWKCLDLIADGTITIQSLFMVLYSPSRQMAGQYIHMSGPFPSKSLPTHHSPIIP